MPVVSTSTADTGRSKMSDYKTTRDAARTITTRYEKMLRSLAGDYQDEMVVNDVD